MQLRMIFQAMHVDLLIALFGDFANAAIRSGNELLHFRQTD